MRAHLLLISDLFLAISVVFFGKDQMKNFIQFAKVALVKAKQRWRAGSRSRHSFPAAAVSHVISPSEKR